MKSATRFGKVQSQIILHRLEIMDDVMKDVFFNSSERLPYTRQDMTEALDILMEEVKRGEVRVNLEWFESVAVKLAARDLLIECVEGSTLMDMARDIAFEKGEKPGPGMIEGQHYITAAYKASLERAYDSLPEKINGIGWPTVTATIYHRCYKLDHVTESDTHGDKCFEVIDLTTEEGDSFIVEHFNEDGIEWRHIMYEITLTESGEFTYEYERSGYCVTDGSFESHEYETMTAEEFNDNFYGVMVELNN